MADDELPTVVVPNQTQTGTRLNDIYEIDSLIATGGMGQVYRGHAIETGDPVAIKMIRTDLLENESAMGMFRREAAALHQLHHEAIVRYFVFTVDRKLQRAYLAMEFVQGEPLGKVVQRGPLDADTTLSLMRRVAGGLAAAHQAGIVHRDVSPDNIIIPDNDVRRARIIDFGIAKNSLAEGTMFADTFVGKYRYASPEQFGEFGGQVTGKSDIYSLGLVLAGCLLGKPLDMGQTLSDAVTKRRSAPDLSAVDERLRPLLTWMTQPDPADRPPDMAAVAAWTPAAAARPAAAAKPSKPAATRPGSGSGGGKGVLVGAGVLVALVAAGAAGWWWMQKGAETPVGPPVTAEERFALDYNGGPCVLLAVTNAAIQTYAVDAYGAAVEPFEGFDKGFTEKYKADAKIDLRQITPAQCAAVTLLSSLKTPMSARPDVALSQPRAVQGETITATVTARQPWLALLRVAEDGTVTLVGDGFGKSGPRPFKVPVRRVKDPPGQPQLLVALAADAALESVRGIRPDQPADQVFQAISQDPALKKAGLTGGLAYYKVQ